MRKLKSLILLMMLLISGCDQRSPQSPDVIVDFSLIQGNINMHYGANEDDNWVSFVSDKATHENHRQVGSEYIRIWLVDEHYKESTIPFDDWAFDFWALDSLLDAVHGSGATPFIVLANAPDIMREYDDEYAPPNIWEFAYYAKQVAIHCREYCLSKGCDTSEWYFEVWNEPWKKEWWEDGLYIRLFEVTSKAIKEVIPAKVGGYSLTFYPGKTKDAVKFIATDPDFISLHHYGNARDEFISDAKRIDDIKLLMHDSMLDLKKIFPGEIINSEYSSDYTVDYMGRLDEQYTAMWYASSLIWQIKSQAVSIEMFYSGTTLHADRGYGMWSTEGKMRYWPTYHMKRSFVDANRHGSVIFKSSSLDDIDILAVGNAEKFITVVNRLDMKRDITLGIKGGYKILTDIDDNTAYVITDDIASISLDPYEVRFFRVAS